MKPCSPGSIDARSVPHPQQVGTTRREVMVETAATTTATATPTTGHAGNAAHDAIATPTMAMPIIQARTRIRSRWIQFKGMVSGESSFAGRPRPVSSHGSRIQRSNSTLYGKDRGKGDWRGARSWCPRAGRRAGGWEWESGEAGGRKWGRGEDGRSVDRRWYRRSPEVHRSVLCLSIEARRVAGLGTSRMTISTSSCPALLMPIVPTLRIRSRKLCVI